MAGHSKWANIKHRKARVDAQRSKVFTRLIRELVIASRLGGPSQNDNPRLRSAVIAALAANMSKDTIEKAIAKGAGNNQSENVEELTYEGYATGGVAVLIEAISDNRNRTASEIRHVFSKHGGSLGTSGSVAYLFRKTGILNYASGANEETIFEAATDAGAEDVQLHEDGSISVLTDVGKFNAVVNALAHSGNNPDEAKLAMLPETTTKLDVAAGVKHIHFLDALEELDDVQQVYSNAEIPDEAYNQLEQT